MDGMEMVGRERNQGEVLAQLSEAAGTNPLRVRVPMTILDDIKKSYTSLPQASWRMDVASVEGVKALQKVLDLTFDLTVRLGGPMPMLEYLQQCQAAIEGGDAARD